MSAALDPLYKLAHLTYQVAVQFPASALTIPRQRMPAAPATGDMADTSANQPAAAATRAKVVSDHVYQLCTSDDSVSAELARDPTMAPGDAWKKLYGHHTKKQSRRKSSTDKAGRTDNENPLQRAAQCGKWGPSQPSELFLQLYDDALCTLDEGVERAMVSPSLMGSHGVMPLTIISVVPDIVRHMANLIVRAEREVFLATNYWQNSVASQYITNAIKELSRRAGQRNAKVVMKVIYDRGSPRQILEPHYLVPEKAYTAAAVGLPHPHEIPHVDLQVMNYHEPMMGTFHAKYMVVDRRIAVLQSNNIQDNDNLEMLVHLEGPVVDSLYDMALLSWHKELRPPLPTHDSPAARAPLRAFEARHGTLFNPDGTLKGTGVVVDPSKMPPRSRTLPYEQRGGGVDVRPSSTPAPPATKTDRDGDAPAGASAHSIGPDALPEHLADDPHYDDDIAGEVARVQASLAPRAGETQMDAVARHLNHTTNAGFRATAPDCPPADAMTPLLPHVPHEPFPIALVCRPPYGPPNHSCVETPQNAAWLSALRNARKNVFIQSPTLNAEPLVPAIVEACERGVDVFCYICIGYNDAGELLPMQGGHNEMVAAHLYKTLSDRGRQHLHYYWYVAKDQTAPLVQTRHKRSCHVKLLIVDERVGIVGNGNQDTQSWFHSQEINVMVDSAEICAAWIDALRRNQNTHLYGALRREDGVWRDAEGKGVEGAMGVDPGRFSWAKGFVGAIKRLQGTGGF